MRAGSCRTSGCRAGAPDAPRRSLPGRCSLAQTRAQRRRCSAVRAHCQRETTDSGSPDAKPGLDRVMRRRRGRHRRRPDRQHAHRRRRDTIRLRGRRHRPGSLAGVRRRWWHRRRSIRRRCQRAAALTHQAAAVLGRLRVETARVNDRQRGAVADLCGRGRLGPGRHPPRLPQQRPGNDQSRHHVRPTSYRRSRSVWFMPADGICRAGPGRAWLGPPGQGWIGRFAAAPWAGRLPD